MWREPISTSYYLWAAFTLAIFVFAGGIIEVTVGKGDAIFWNLCSAYMAAPHVPVNFEFVMAFYGLVLLIPSIASGWVAQAVVKIVMGLKKNRNIPKSATQS